jgi:hypothetical protein
VTEYLCLLRSFYFCDMTILGSFDIQDVPAPVALAAGATSRVPGVAERSGAAQQLEGLMKDLHGKVTAHTLDVSSAENASPKLESESQLFWLEETLGATICGWVIGSMQSFCIEAGS